MQNFKIVAYLLLGSTDSRGYVRFTPKYSIVGGEEWVSGGEKNLLIIKASLATAEVPAGGCGQG